LGVTEITGYQRKKGKQFYGMNPVKDVQESGIQGHGGGCHSMTSSEGGDRITNIWEFIKIPETENLALGRKTVKTAA